MGTIITVSFFIFLAYLATLIYKLIQTKKEGKNEKANTCNFNSSTK